MNKWKKYKDANRDKVKAQNIALYAHKEQKQCSIKGCDSIAERHHPDYKKPSEIIWLCRKHHLMIHGRLRGKCSLCEKPNHAKGFCKTHYAKSFRKIQGW